MTCADESSSIRSGSSIATLPDYTLPTYAQLREQVAALERENDSARRIMEQANAQLNHLERELAEARKALGELMREHDETRAKYGGITMATHGETLARVALAKAE